MNKNSKIIKSKTMFLFLLTITFSCSSEAPKPPMKTLSADEIKFPLPKKTSQTSYTSKSSFYAPTSEQISAIKRSLDYEGEDRWANWDVKYLAEDKVLLYRIALYGMSNEIAMDGYIDLIRDISHKHAPKSNCQIRLMKNGKRVKGKYINAKF